MKYLFTILALVAFASAETFDRPCRTPEELGVKTGFLPELYLGFWYEIERYEQFFQRDSDCVTATYTLNADGSIRVFNQAYRIDTSERLADTGRAVISFPEEVPLRAMLNVTFGDGLFPGDGRSNYWVLSTDYSNYAFVVSCTNIPVNRSREAYWLLSRTRVLAPAARTRANELIAQFIDPARIRVTNQDDRACQRINRSRPSIF